MGVEPTKETAWTSLCAKSASTASLSPCTTLKTPLGNPASRINSATIRDGEGSIGLGFSTKVFPAAMATGYIQAGTMTGKLKGVIPATTPSGWRKVQLSILVETWSVKSPFRSCGMPQANSMMSMPRSTSPRASEKTLPCSLVIARARSSLCALISPRYLFISRARRSGGRFAQAGKAALAAATAASTSADDDRVTLRCLRPVAGLKMSCVLPLAPGTTWPSMKLPTRDSAFLISIVFMVPSLTLEIEERRLFRGTCPRIQNSGRRPDHSIAPAVAGFRWVIFSQNIAHTIDNVALSMCKR